MKRHIKIAAVLYAARGGLDIVAALIMFAMLGGVPDFSTGKTTTKRRRSSCLAALYCLLS